MQVTINGEPQEIAENCNAAMLVELLNMQNDKIAMEVNKEIVPRSQYETFKLSEGDQIEIVRAIGGG